MKLTLEGPKVEPEVRPLAAMLANWDSVVGDRVEPEVSPEDVRATVIAALEAPRADPEVKPLLATAWS